MTLLVAWVVFPLLLAALSAAVGLLVEGIARVEVPRTLLLPLGLATIVVLAQPLALADSTAELIVPVVVAAAAAGLARSLPWRRGASRDLWPAAAAVAVFAAFAAPVVLSGEATLGGYIELDDTASWLALTDRIMEQGASAAGLPPSSYEATLDFYLGSLYPLGTFLPLGTGARLLGQDPIWLYQPYVAFLAAILSLALYSVGSGVLRSARMRGLAVLLASQPAILYAYAAWGGAKEVAAAALLALMSALAAPLMRDWTRPGAVFPLALASAATLAVLSTGGAVWVLPVLLPIAAVAVRSRGAAKTIKPAAVFAALFVLMSIPALLGLRFLFAPAASTITQTDRLANLIQPLSLLQVFGIWPNGEFRLPPPDMTSTYVLVAVTAVAAGVGAVYAVRRGAGRLLLYLGASLAGGGTIVIFGSAWVDAKALAIASPAVVLTALVGGAVLLRHGRRIEGVVVIAAIAGGIVWSNVLTYREINLAPAERLAELREIGEAAAGRGPTLMTDYEPYGARYLLRDADPEGASELRRRQVPLRGGGTLPKGSGADIDEFDLGAVLTYRTLVLRRSPFAARPPSPYELVSRGRYYEVWERPAGAAVDEHRSLRRGRSAAPRASCEEVRDLARRAGPRGRLVAATGSPALVVENLRARPPAAWSATGGRAGAFAPSSAGSLEGVFSVARPGRYGLWLGGSYRSAVTAWIDGRRVARSRHELSHDYPYLRLATVELARGTHRVRIEYDGPDAHPGSAGRPIALGPVVISPPPSGPDLTAVAPEDYRELCGRRLDWIEVVAGGPAQRG